MNDGVDVLGHYGKFGDGYAALLSGAEDRRLRQEAEAFVRKCFMPVLGAPLHVVGQVVLAMAGAD